MTGPQIALRVVWALLSLVPLWVLLLLWLEPEQLVDGPGWRRRKREYSPSLGEPRSTWFETWLHRATLISFFAGAALYGYFAVRGMLGWLPDSLIYGENNLRDAIAGVGAFGFGALAIQYVLAKAESRVTPAPRGTSTD